MVAFGPYAPSVQAGETYAETRIVKALMLAQADVAKAAKDTAKAAAKEAAKAADEAAKAAAKEAAQTAKDEAQAAKDAADADDAPTVTIDRNGIRVEDASGKKKRVHIGLGGTDREYDSFDQFVHEDRGLAFMVFGIVFIVFLTPVLITGLFIWYKLRKNRMLNDTMVQLAEKGVVADRRRAAGARTRAGPPAPRIAHGRAGAAWSSRSRRCAATPPGRTCARASSSGASDCRSSPIRCSTTARPTGSAWCCCSWASATPCCGISRTASSPRRRPALRPTSAGGRRVRPTPCRTRR